LLAEKNGSALIDAVEIQEASVEYFNMNINENGLVGRVNVISGDLRQHRRLFEAGAYDLVVSNPPYFPRGSGKPAPDESRATARDESAAA
jgi:tRNA1Val (adenine37-N6)-methyltransferase